MGTCASDAGAATKTAQAGAKPAPAAAKKVEDVKKTAEGAADASKSAAPAPAGAAPSGAKPKYEDLEDQDFDKDCAGRQLKAGDKVMVFLPPDSYPPEHPAGAVTGHKNGRVGVALDNGLQKGVVMQELLFCEDDDHDEEDDDAFKARWQAPFPIGSAVQIIDLPEGGDPNHMKKGKVTGFARGRIGVEFNDGSGKAGFSEQDLRHAELDEEDEEGLLAKKYYPVGSQVEISDPMNAAFGKHGTVAGHARGRIGVTFEDGTKGGFTHQDVTPVIPGEDEEEPNFAARWKVGEEVFVYCPPTGGKDHNMVGTVVNFARGRVGVHCTEQFDEATAKCITITAYDCGVAPRALRPYSEDDEDTDELASRVFPIGTRVQVLNIDPACMHGKFGVVTGVDPLRERVGVKMTEDETMQGFPGSNLRKC